MKLTQKNYFTPKNKYLSNSKISDYLRSKDYFYKKNISHEIQIDKSDEMLIGSACDLWLTKSRKAFERKYKEAVRRDKKNPPKSIIELTPLQYSKVVAMCEAVERTPAFWDLQDDIKQDILSLPLHLGEFQGLCGIPDFYRIEHDTICIITDLKTCKPVDSDYFYYRHCLDFGYFRQQAMYQILLKAKYPLIEQFVSRHLAVFKDDPIYPVQAYMLAQDQIEAEKVILWQLIAEIGKEVNFKDNLASWDTSVDLERYYNASI